MVAWVRRAFASSHCSIAFSSVSFCSSSCGSMVGAIQLAKPVGMPEPFSSDWKNSMPGMA